MKGSRGQARISMEVMEVISKEKVFDACDGPVGMKLRITSDMFVRFLRRFSTEQNEPPRVYFGLPPMSPYVPGLMPRYTNYEVYYTIFA